MDERLPPAFTCPCEICGNMTYCTATKRCNSCWETEHNLERYLKYPAGRDNVLRILAKMGTFGDMSPPVFTDPFPDGQHQ